LRAYNAATGKWATKTYARSHPSVSPSQSDDGNPGACD
jgi:hypothetical protein